ncbi:MAG: hypothetical protein MN733_20340 [Nitrososphaera sp.]|nr:hypothetical protein [Nitrososphaera sp.]
MDGRTQTYIRLIILLAVTIASTSCVDQPISRGSDLSGGGTKQSNPPRVDLTAKKETTAMRGKVVVVHGWLPPRKQSENEPLPRALSAWLFMQEMAKKGIITNSCGPETARFSVKEVFLGSYEASFIEVTGWRGEWCWPLWGPGEYLLFFKRPECVEIRIVKIGVCGYGYVDAGKPLPDGPAHVCVKKNCESPHEYVDSLSSPLREEGGTPFIINPRAIEFFEKQWGLQAEPFESAGRQKNARAFKSTGIRLDSLRKCLEAGRCLPIGDAADNGGR